MQLYRMAMQLLAAPDKAMREVMADYLMDSVKTTQEQHYYIHMLKSDTFISIDAVMAIVAKFGNRQERKLVQAVRRRFCCVKSGQFAPVTKKARLNNLRMTVLTTPRASIVESASELMSSVLVAQLAKS